MNEDKPRYHAGGFVTGPSVPVRIERIGQGIDGLCMYLDQRWTTAGDPHRPAGQGTRTPRDRATATQGRTVNEIPVGNGTIAQRRTTATSTKHTTP